MSLNSDNSRVNAKNAHLRRAQINKNDEFYTSVYDVRKFIDSCADYFEGKIVYCNCDDPEESEIAKYFIRNYAKLKLKGLFCTYYRQNPEIKAYKYYYKGVKMRRKEIEGNGSFDSAEFDDIYNKCDIVVTNPPFSLANKFIQFLLSKNVKFLIICNVTIASNNPTIQPFESGELHFCAGQHNRPERFYLPWYCTNREAPNGRKFCRLGACIWMTNTEIDKRKRFVSLTKFDEAKHKTFDNWQHCININRLSQLPCDYEGLIAVPITFLYKPVSGYRFFVFCRRPTRLFRKPRKAASIARRQIGIYALPNFENHQRREAETMAQKPIIIYELKNSLSANSDNFYAIGELNQFDSAILRRKYCGYGSFELWAPITAENKAYFTMPANNAQRFLYFGDNAAGFVECVQAEVDSAGKLRYHISGRTCEALLCFRAFGLARKSGSDTILTNTTTFSGLTAAQIIPKMLSDCYQGDWDANTTRRIPFLAAPTFSSNIPARTFDFQRSGGTLYDGVIDFLNQEILSLGFWIKFDPANRRLIPYVYAGVDRSTSQNANTSVVFSDQLNDILQSQYIFDMSNFCNVAYVFGEGEGSDRVFAQATRQTDTYNSSCYTGTGNFPNFGLRELYVDARDVSRKSTGTITTDSDTTTTLTDSQYFQALAKRGTQKLAEHNTLNTFNAVIRTEGETMYKYGADYTLGDIITIEDTRLGISVNTRVTASEETFGSQYSLRLSFGEEPATLNDTLNSINNNFTN